MNGAYGEKKNTAQPNRHMFTLCSGAVINTKETFVLQHYIFWSAATRNARGSSHYSLVKNFCRRCTVGTKPESLNKPCCCILMTVNWTWKLEKYSLQTTKTGSCLTTKKPRLHSILVSLDSIHCEPHQWDPGGRLVNYKPNNIFRSSLDENFLEGGCMENSQLTPWVEGEVTAIRLSGVAGLTALLEKPNKCLEVLH